MVKGKKKGTFREQRKAQRNTRAVCRTTKKRGTFREKRIAQRDIELIKRLTRTDKKKIEYAAKMERLNEVI